MATRLRRAAAVVVIAGSALLASCAGTTPTTGATAGSTPPNRYPRDGELRLNQVQLLGSHNSYHRRTPQALRDGLERIIPGLTRYWDYEHPPLDEQFATLGIRQIELDVWADPEGGRWSRHAALPLVGLPPDDPDPALREKGFKTFHVQELDYATTCATFVGCLQVVRRWSDANPGHVPIMVLVEVKAEPVPDPLSLGFTQPLPIDATTLDAIDTEITSVFPRERLVTPDVVRGSRASLDDAVRSDGWPTLGAVRGKVMFALDNEGLADEYATGHPALAGRVMFTSAEPGSPEAGFVKLNDAEADRARIETLVRQGYVVRTRADADTKQARDGSTATRDAALAGGAQWVSTDYPRPDPAFGTGYVVTIPGGTPGRCNPLNAPSWCTASDVEDPGALRSR